MAAVAIGEKNEQAVLKTNGEVGPGHRVQNVKGKGTDTGKQTQRYYPWRNDRQAQKGKGEMKGPQKNQWPNGRRQWANDWESGKTHASADSEKGAEAIDASKLTEKGENSSMAVGGSLNGVTYAPPTCPLLVILPYSDTIHHLEEENF